MASQPTARTGDTPPSKPGRGRKTSARRSEFAPLLKLEGSETERGTKAPGIKELAAKLGLGISTVSRAMNNRARVDEKTRKRVLAMADKMGYVPDATARRLKSHPRLRIEVLFSPYPDAHHAINPAALAMINALRSRALERGILLTLREISEPGSRAGIAVAADIISQIENRAAEVVVTYGHFHEDTLNSLRKATIPVVCLQSLPAGPRQLGIMANTRGASYEAVKYMAALGHQRFALICGKEESLHHRGYIEGFTEAVEEFELLAPASCRVYLPAAQINEEGATQAVLPLLALPADKRPTAFVFGSDWLAMGGMKAIRSTGLNIPADVSLTGFDNVAASAQATPALTTFDVHHEMMADAVLDAAVELLEKPNASYTPEQAIRMVNADLTKRGSCCAWGRLPRPASSL